MTIVAPPPPAKVLRTLRADLKQRARSAASIVSPKRVKITRGLALYQAAAAPELVVGSVPVGWRFVIFAPEVLFWADVIGNAVDTVLSGPAVGLLLDVADQADRTSVDGEARILIYPLLDAAALWVASADEQFWPFSPAIEPPCNRASLLSRWQARIDALSHHSVDLLE